MSEIGGFSAIERGRVAPDTRRGGGNEDSFRKDRGLDHRGPCKPSACLELYLKSHGKQEMNKTLVFCGERDIENYTVHYERYFGVT